MEIFQSICWPPPPKPPADEWERAVIRLDSDKCRCAGEYEDGRRHNDSFFNSSFLSIWPQQQARRNSLRNFSAIFHFFLLNCCPSPISPHIFVDFKVHFNVPQFNLYVFFLFELINLFHLFICFCWITAHEIVGDWVDHRGGIAHDPWHKFAEGNQNE